MLSDDGRTAGYFSLAWASRSDAGTELQMLVDGGWTTIYRGVDTATTLSGLANGDYTFRVRSGDAPWGPPLTITVEHHSLRRAFTFFGLGAVLFGILLAVLMRSSQAVRQQK